MERWREWLAETDPEVREPEPAPVWPPKGGHEAPRLPLVPEREAPLTLDRSVIPEPEPEFTPSKLEKAPEAAKEAPRAVVYDRKNPSGRTRADRVLRPTDEDRDRRIREFCIRATLQGAGCALLVMFVFGHGPFYVLAAVTCAGALAGFASFNLGDGVFSWMPTMLVVGAIAGLLLNNVFMLLTLTPIMAVAGWLLGMARESELSIR